MDRAQQRQIAEALILAAPEPIAAARLAELLPQATPATVRRLVEELNAEYAEQGRAFEIWEVAGGYQLRTRAEYAPWVRQLQQLRPQRLSQPALETLAVVAYRQPVTRAEIEHVRGVDVGATLRGLVERRMVRIAGHREVPGRPALYATTRRFLEVFGLNALEELPSLRTLEELVGGELPEGVADGPRGAVAVSRAEGAPAPDEPAATGEPR